MLVDVIGGNKKAKFQNDMLRACDMFEPFKKFALHSRIEVNGIDDPQTAIEAVKHAYKKEGGYVLFAGILNKDGSSVYFLEQGISVISTISSGNHGWLMFSDMLKKLGYNPVTDSTMKVTSLVN
jgi:hypothetical protein